jgi:hypothetical protein
MLKPLLSLGKVIPCPIVLQGRKRPSGVQKNLRASLRSAVFFCKNLAGQGHGIIFCPMKASGFNIFRVKEEFFQETIFSQSTQ